MSEVIPATTLRRLQREIKALQRSQPDGVTVFVNTDSITHWTAIVAGPSETPYEGLLFKFTLSFGSSYPIAGPKIACLSKIWHPNFGVNGHICVDILNSMWTPSLTTQKLLLSLQSLLFDANPSSPLNGIAANMWREAKETGDWSEYKSQVRWFYLQGQVTTCDEESLKQAIILE